MIERSFIFLDRISRTAEQNLWQKGIVSWEVFLETKHIQGIGSQRKLFYDMHIRKAKELLHSRNYVALVSLFPKNEHWRFYFALQHEACALDIETSGYYGDITVIGLHDSSEGYSFVKNKNLFSDSLCFVLAQAQLLLTFNGSSFDVPMIAKEFPKTASLFSKHIHIDLRHVASRLALTGGLKAIEKELGIVRDVDISSMKGDDAIVLWNLYTQSHDEEALRLLLLYNEADAKNLFPLANILISRLWRTIYKEEELPLLTC